MGCRLPPDSPGCKSTQENGSAIPPGMERCLKKLVPGAGPTDFQDSEKGGWEPTGPSGGKSVAGGSAGTKRVYTRNRRRAKS